MYRNIAVIGSDGAIGSAVVNRLRKLYPSATIHPFCRNPSPESGDRVIDYHDEQSIAKAAVKASTQLDLVFVATGILHYQGTMPEKSLGDLSAEQLQTLFAVNSIVPALIAKHFLPRLTRDGKSVFAVLSARIGSISDNRLGGWYSYRASKAALNMIIKNAAIEIARTNKQAIVIGLHPGTVDSPLSQPFQKSIESSKIFTPEFAARKLISVIDQLTPEQSGKCLAWDGQQIEP